MRNYKNGCNLMNNHDFIDMFEEELSIYTGAPYVVLVNSCTNAIFLALKYLQNTGYDFSEAITVPEQTYIGAVQSIINAGLDFKFTNQQWVGNYQFGDTPVWDYAVEFHSDIYKPGQMQCLSFQQKKMLAIGEGGAILLDDKEAYKVLKRMAWDGRDVSLQELDDREGIIHGYHMNMIPDVAAQGLLLLNQLEYLKDTSKVYNWSKYYNLQEIEYLRDMSAD